MPNYITNIIELIGDKDEIKTFIDKFSTDYPEKPRTSYDNNIVYLNKDGNFGWLNTETNVFTRRDKPSVLGVPEGYLVDMVEAWTRFPDFEKIFPVPQVIKDVGVISSHVVDAVYAKYNTPYSDNALLASLQRITRSKVEIRPEDELDFERACKAYEETGYAYWYDYQIDKWGTKWNANDCVKLSENKFEFETAWSGVLNLIIEMSKEFSGTILYKYADEDTGSNTAKYTIASGIVLESYEPSNGSIEAYELVFEIKPDEKKMFELVDGEYRWKDDEM